MSKEPTPISRKTRCPACGKSLHISQDDCGNFVLCPACGRSTRIPYLPPEIFLPAQAPSPATAMDDMVYGIPVPQSTDPVPQAAAPPPSRRRPAVASLLACLILAESLVVVWLLKDRPPVIADATRAALLETKVQADQSLARGDIVAAHQQYQSLQEMAAPLDLRDDPQMVAILSDARQAQGLVLERLLKREASRQAMAAPPPATQPAITTPEPPLVTVVPEPAPVTRPATIVATPEPPRIAPATRPVVKPGIPVPQSVVVLPKRPPVRPTRIPQGGLSDEEIGQAIERAVNNILGQMNGSMIRGTRPNDPTSMGVNALCVYALLQAGQAISDERLNVRAKFMKDVLSAMRDMPLGGGPETYTRGIRATALALYNRPEDRRQLAADVDWLKTNHRHGAYTYTRASSNGDWDNSNSQYGLLGVWSGAEVGVEVPGTYWSAVQDHWTFNQCPEGDWSYRAGGAGAGRLSMTVAGIASLFVTHDYLDAPSFGSVVGRNPFPPPLARGLAWLETGNNVLPDRLDGYTLYGIERVGLASGFKYFGDHDWYRELARWIIDGQAARGGWGGGGWGGGERSEVQNAYCLLFLARGRHPILMNKLRFDGAWANRPRDLANLARYASAQLERPLNWQIVPLSRDWTDWADSPILYLASHEPVSLKEQDYVKLRRYINSGGLLFTHADGGSPRFNQFVLDLGRKLAPDYEWTDLPADHDVYSVNFPIAAKPRMRCISNGVRLLMLHSPEDISQWWQLRADKTRTPVFEFGTNLFIYEAGKGDLRNRLTSTVIPPPRDAAGFNVLIAQVRYGGNWNPEPGALERFASLFQYQTGYGLLREVVDMEDLRAARWPIAVMTGTAPFTPSARQIENLRKFVEDGGTLYIDAAGGSGLFSTSVHASMLAAAFPGKTTSVLGETHPVIAGSGDGMDDLAKPQLRPYAERKLGRAAARVEMLTSGAGRVIFSPVDTTFGLLGTNTWGVLGYKPAYAQGLLKNVILWAMDGAQSGEAAGK
ncbi:MAG: DUF4159 domain-containing protein [Tepidisphaeraceae bacterium]|jgi:hypothetical protein